ncbi:PRC-barrel domain-containing protein [Microvirga terrestris]|uniref:PRC-barrel domain-containing protein n=1 Tax=Microvirga terrestris TaxID=2791024 RepID=A0ABS0HXS9_9HYPH|nr:PRC-barrel domain-containing protein [Microvirga terrestris]MBF9198061.1 PRC-barrel domain-containing protein [Microvirga terrestris]
MTRMKLSAGLAATALLAGSALAQTTAPTQSAGPGQVMTQMPRDLMRGSQLMGIDVYEADNQKIGDIDEVMVDRQGKIHGLVVGVGGFLGIGQKDVAIPFDQVQWMSNQEVQASANTGPRSTNTADTTVPRTATGGAGQPATTGSTAAGTIGSPGAAGTLGGAGTGGGPAGAATTASGGDSNTPARAIVKMTKSDLQSAPDFRYSTDANRAGATGNTNPPPQSVNTPGNTAPNAPRQ